MQAYHEGQITFNGFRSKSGPTGQTEPGNPMRHATGTRSPQPTHEAHSQGVEEGTKSQSWILGVRTHRCEKGF
ncbi:transcription initiation factor TFIID subunit TAF12 [Granulicella aggregans]|uniref:Transcription initiation factor TFIID subunit TAF12 n=1 Tax=Granulicella aggregans TaxID=474949 RepID=A0A7W7ZHQ5_9BACT|nr:transcription initiation factor TFIID subunit TAF12 [Granulicella aggregans]